MKTERLYQKDVYMKECRAEIISCEYKDDAVLLEFDKTIFFPTGGGQSCDKGHICIIGEETAGANDSESMKNTVSATRFEITDVFESESRILHKVIKHQNTESVLCRTSDRENTSESEGIAQSLSQLTPGTCVLLQIDWAHRFDNMQRHCGEHILSGMFYREFGGVNRGFHMGDDYMTIDISLEENPDFKVLTWDMAKQAELAANEVIWDNEPVVTRRFQTREEAAKLPLRKVLAIDEDITIVCVGNPENASDCVACCGTHPSSAGQIGLIKIWKVEPNKGMFRVYCEAGRRAYLDYEKKHDIITAVSSKYSAGIDDLENKIAIAEEKTKSLRFELGAMRKIVIDSRIEDIKKELSLISSAPSAAGSIESPLIIRRYSDMKPDDLMHIGKPFIGSIEKLLIAADLNTNTVMLFSDGKHFDCGRLIKENAHIYNGKGGGRADNARAVFPSTEYLNTFIDLLGKHLR